MATKQEEIAKLIAAAVDQLNKGRLFDGTVMLGAIVDRYPDSQDALLAWGTGFAMLAAATQVQPGETVAVEAGNKRQADALAWANKAVEILAAWLAANPGARDSAFASFQQASDFSDLAKSVAASIGAPRAEVKIGDGDSDVLAAARAKADAAAAAAAAADKTGLYIACGVGALAIIWWLKK